MEKRDQAIEDKMRRSTNFQLDFPKEVIEKMGKNKNFEMIIF